jgi:hypothetical protein
MPGMTLGIGETNPKKGAVQYRAERIDGVPFVITSGASVSSAPIGSIVTLQESVATGLQKIVLGAGAYTDGSQNLYTVLAIGFLEAATQVDGDINQTVGEYKSGDMAAMITDINVVAAVPMLASYNPVSGLGAYVNEDGKLTVTAYANVAFPGVVSFKTPGQQVTGQLKTGYCYARLATNVIGTV